MDENITLREYIDLRFSELEQRNAAIRTLLIEATQDREREIERRLLSLNELRSEVLADRALFVTRVAFDAVATRIETFLDRRYYEEQHKALIEKLDMTAAALTGKLDSHIAALADLRTEISSVRSRNAGMVAALGVALTVVTIVMIVVTFVMQQHP